MVLFAPTDADAAARFKKDEGLTGTLVTAGAAEMAQVLNAVMAPRVYVFSPDWRLVWQQRQFGSPAYDPFLDRSFRAASGRIRP